MTLRSVPSTLVSASVVLAIAFAQPLGTGAISGAAVDGANGNPVRRAIVTLTLEGTPRRWATTRTDESGRFQFQGLPAGKYDLDATKTGMGTAVYGANHLQEFGNLITLRKGESRGGLKVHFMHPASISGRVYDSDGEPLSGVTMNLVRPSRNLGAPVLTLYRGSITDDRGVYRFLDIDAGRYYLRAVPPTRVRAPGFSLNQPILGDQYYGGVKDYKEATALHVGESDITGLDFHLNSEPSVDIHGRILGIPEQPEPAPSSGAHHAVTIDGFFIQVEISSADGLPQTRFGAPVTGPDHSFEIGGIPAGRYLIEAETRGGAKQYCASQLIDLTPGSSDVELTLSPAVDIQGTVRVEGTLPADSSAAKSRFNGGSFRIELTNPGTHRLYLAEWSAAGHFTIKDVPPGEWQLRVNPMPPGFLKSAKYGEKDVRFTTLHLDSPSDAALNIVVSMNTATVEGKLETSTGDPARAGILVAAIGPYHDFPRFYYQGITDAGGKFRVSDIAPGKYKVFALENMDAQNFRTPEAADQLGTLGETIDIAEGATVEAHPKLIPADRAGQAVQ